MTLPALNPGETLRIIRTGPGPGEATVRIDYVVEATGRAPRPRWVVCGFAASGLSTRKSELVRVVTERGAVSGASLYLMQRYWLETPDALVADPGGIGDEAALPQVPRSLAYGLQQTVAGLPKMAIYGLLSAAYALVFGLAGRINLAFGELAAVGAAGTATTIALSLAAPALPPLLAMVFGLVAAMAAAALYGGVGGYLTIMAVRGRSVQPALIATVGLSIALMETLRLTGGTGRFWLPPLWNDVIPIARSGDFVVTTSAPALGATGIGLMAAGALLMAMQLSGYGRAWRACADDSGAAALLGIDARRVLLLTLALSGALAGLSGFLVVLLFGGFGFADGFVLGLKALAGAVIGGIGSVPGALLGGILIGAFEAGWSATMPIEARDIALYSALVVFLIFRPGGLFGYGKGIPRSV